MKVDYIPVEEIVETVSDTHSFNKDKLYAINTSDVENGYLLNPPLLKTDELKGQFKKTISKNDILFSEIRPKNRHFALVTIDDTADYVVSTKLMVLRKKNNNVDLKYFYYWLTNDYTLQILQNRAENRICSFPQITYELLCDYKVPVPSLDIQVKISNLLFKLDSKIKINNDIISELESIAKTIYDYWFLQFDFPDENGKPYKSSGGKMVWNEELKREIPEGWEYKPLIDIEGNIITGKTPPTTDLDNYNGNIPFITIGDMRNNVYIVKTVQTLSTKGANSQLRKYLPKNSLVVSCIATIGLVSITTQNSQTNQQINGIVLSCSHNLYFLYFALKKHFINSVDVKTGNTFSNMNKNEFSGIKFLYNKDYVKLYYEKVKVIFDLIKNAQLENQELASIRDFLLPMLMNGQVTFKESK